VLLKSWWRVRTVVLGLSVSLLLACGGAPESTGDIGQKPSAVGSVEARKIQEFVSDVAPEISEPLLPEGIAANRLVGRCLRHLGVTVWYAGAGGIYRPNDSSQPHRAPALQDLCLEAFAEHGVVALDSNEPTTREKRYQAYLSAYQCLSDLGLDVDPPPSRQAFQAGENWSPFNGVPTDVNNQRRALEGPAVECAVP
jgi:hypothetical protein